MATQSSVAPVSVSVPGYEQLTVRVEMPGYQPWSKKVYARKSSTQVSAHLTPVKVARPAARKAPAASTTRTAKGTQPAAPAPRRKP
jgi:hypothetical protein